MLLDEIAAGFLKMLGRIFVEVVVEILIKGPGYFIAKVFFKPPIDPDGWQAGLCGIILWVALGVGGYFVFSTAGLAGGADA